MPMDTPSGESNASLSVRDAAALFDAPPPEKKAQPEAQAEDPAKVETPESPEATQADPDPETVEDAPEDSDETVTIEVDGKKVELKKSELADHYKNGLRQADYTRKTMEAAEQRKTAEAETRKAQEERQKYAQGLQQSESLLSAALGEQENIDWFALLQQNPEEYHRQKHLKELRQAKLEEVKAQLKETKQSEFFDRIKNTVETIQRESQATLDKIPEWKDEKRAVEEKAKIAEELLSRGFPKEMIFGLPPLVINGQQYPNPDAPGLSDHRILVMARDAMLYRKMMDKAKAAAKKVENLPQKVERPGGGDTNPTDGRTTAMKQLAKSGSIADAAAVFDRMFK